MTITKQKIASLPAALLILGTQSQAATLFNGTGADTDAILGSVNAFKSALGNGSTTPNAATNTNFADGFRAINWDAAPDAVSSPNNFPGGFFNTDFSPRARGMSFSTAGTGFVLSATVASGVGTNFSNLNASYATEFTTFSTERLFSPIGSNILDVLFFDPTNPTQGALVDGFGAIFTDVDVANQSRIEFYDVNDNLLTTAFADPLDKGLSFTGAHFDTEGEILARARVFLGNANLGANDGIGSDVVVLDDFIAGEMVAIPEPSSTLLLVSAGFLAISRRKRS